MGVHSGVFIAGVMILKFLHKVCEIFHDEG